MHHCSICGRGLVGTSWLCCACAKEHGLTGPVSEWPEWARYLQSTERRERRIEAHERRNVHGDSVDVLCYGECDD